MKTMQGWRESTQPFTTYFTESCEVDAEVYDYFLGVVPPIYIEGGFMVGECSFHHKNIAYHATFIQKDQQFFYEGEQPKV